MQQLEETVRALEQGQMPLEESLKAFEKAMALQKSLKEILDDGDRRIRVLTEGCLLYTSCGVSAVRDADGKLHERGGKRRAVRRSAWRSSGFGRRCVALRRSA